VLLIYYTGGCVTKDSRACVAIDAQLYRTEQMGLKEASGKEEVVTGMSTFSNPNKNQTSQEPVATLSIVSKPSDSSRAGYSTPGDSTPIALNDECLDKVKPGFYRHSSVFTEELPQRVELEFLRHGWANRIITDKDGKSLYFADIPWQWTGTKLDVYRGHPDNKRALASLCRKPLNKRIFYNFQGSDEEHMEIIGSNAYLGVDYFFGYSGRQLRWRETQRRFRCSQHEILTDIDTKEIIARFKNASLLEIWRKKRYGTLVIYSEAQETDGNLLDIVVTTLIAIKQRIREKKRMRGFWNLLATASESATS
jgi:hypothetical protein